MSINLKPAVLVILDGFGISSKNPANAITEAHKPFLKTLTHNYPSMLLQASGLDVGLPQIEVGNSEVGHTNIGSGVLRYQSLPRINRSIQTGEFFQLTALEAAANKIRKGGNLHLIGLLGNGGVHSSQEHLEALLEFARENKLKKKVFIHLFLDGRDTERDQGKEFTENLITFTKKHKIGTIASMCGRSLGMDRNKNWDKIQKAYDAIVHGKAEKYHVDPLQAIQDSYDEKVYDEQMEPVVFTNKKNEPLATINDRDVVISFNFRADRARQLTQALVVNDFEKFTTKKFEDLDVVTFTEYMKGLPVDVLFSPHIIDNPIAKIFSEYGLKQLHIAETEKYAHVTFFLNGMTEEPFAGEERILIPSPMVSTYDEKPEMSANEVTDKIIEAVKADKYDFIAVNYANADMVGHTGNLQACIKAVETVDSCLSRLVPEVVNKGGAVFIVGDHGNAEEMINLVTNKIDKEHNHYPVPFIVAANKFSGQMNPDLKDDLSLVNPVGILADVTPTILNVLGVPQLPEMTGASLL